MPAKFNFEFDKNRFEIEIDTKAGIKTQTCFLILSELGFYNSDFFPLVEHNLLTLPVVSQYAGTSLTMQAVLKQIPSSSETRPANCSTDLKLKRPDPILLD